MEQGQPMRLDRDGRGDARVHSSTQKHDCLGPLRHYRHYRFILRSSQDPDCSREGAKIQGKLARALLAWMELKILVMTMDRAFAAIQGAHRPKMRPSARQPPKAGTSPRWYPSPTR